MSRLLIAGTGSGCGKTTVTCAVLAALKARGMSPTAFKCGPDYLDPMFHRAVSDIQAYNLDPFFLDGEGLRSHLAAHTGEISVIEGVMGYYDGIAATDEASTYTVAKETNTPVLLVISAKSAGNSLGAVMEGFIRHRPDSQIKGIVFNDANEDRYPDLKQIAENAGVRAYGYMPRKEEWSIPGRHLGLLRTDEIAGLKSILTALGRQAEQSVDIGGLIELAGTAPALEAARNSESGGARRDRTDCERAETDHTEYNHAECGSVGCGSIGRDRTDCERAKTDRIKCIRTECDNNECGDAAPDSSESVRSENARADGIRLALARDKSARSGSDIIECDHSECDLTGSVHTKGIHLAAAWDESVRTGRDITECERSECVSTENERTEYNHAEPDSSERVRTRDVRAGSVRTKVIRLAVASDEAFCFHYEENFDLLRTLGCELIFFSPLLDKTLPSPISGLYLPGGYPELHLKILSENISMTESIRHSVENGLPTIAEGGGFLYLHDTLDGFPMCGVIHGTAFKTKGLRRFGYITLTANRNNLLCNTADSIRAHEFHHWDSDSPGDGFTAKKAGRNLSYPCVHATDTLYAGFPQLYFPATPKFAECFAERMARYER